MQTGSQYLGFFKMLSTMPKAYKELGKTMAGIIKNKGNVGGYIEDLKKTAASENDIAFARYLDENLNEGSFGSTLDATAHAEASIRAVRGAVSKASGAMAHAFGTIQRIGGTSSDIAARRPMMDAGRERVQKVMSRYIGRKTTDPKLAADFLNKIEDDLGIWNLGSSDAHRMRGLISESVKTGDIGELQYQYGRSFIDMSLFRYGKYTKSLIQDKIQKAPFSLIREAGTFRFNWPLHDIPNFVNLLHDSSEALSVVYELADRNIRESWDKKSLSQAWRGMDSVQKSRLEKHTRSLRSVAALGIYTLLVDEAVFRLFGEDSKMKKVSSNYGINRLPIIRNVSSILRLASDSPMGFGGTVLDVAIYIPAAILKKNNTIDKEWKKLQKKILNLGKFDALTEIYGLTKLWQRTASSVGDLDTAQFLDMPEFDVDLPDMNPDIKVEVDDRKLEEDIDAAFKNLDL